MHMLPSKRDYYAGGLLILLGLGMALTGPSYRTGTLMHMGPGFMPTALGVILALLGILIAGAAIATPAAEDERILPANPQWWGWFCILAGPVLFIIFGTYFGMAPAIFSCVFFSALGDREGTWRNSALLAILVTGYGVALFSDLLQVPLQAFPSPIVESLWTFASAGLVSYRLFGQVSMPVYAAPIIAVIVASAAVGLLYPFNFGGVVLILSLWAVFGFMFYTVALKRAVPPFTSLIAALFLAAPPAFALVELMNYLGSLSRFVRFR
jgi:hypothetical protein